MSFPTESRLTRTATSTGYARTRYGDTARSTTVLAVRGARTWRRGRAAAVAAARWVRETVTPVGWVAVAVAAVGLIAGLGWGLLEFAVAGGAAALLVVVAVPFLFSARAYDVRLELAHDRVVAGTPVDGELVVTNVGRGVALPGRVDVPVGDGLVDVHVPLLRPQHDLTERVVIPTERRGIVTVGPARTVRGDPLGILTREATWDDVRTLYVHPRTTALRSTAAGFIRDLEGSASRTIVDADFSFHALRPYVPGDSPRQIHWKSTAKTGAMMVRQYEETRRSRMVVVLARGDDEYADDDEFELAVSAAASVGVRGIRDGRDVDVAVGGEVPEFARRAVRTVRELATVSTRTLLDDLAGLERSGEVSALRDVSSLAAESHPDVSIGFLICGSTLTPAQLQSAALAFGGDVAVVALVCAPTEKPGIRRLGPLTVISIGLLDDLRPLLAKGSAS
ncbi:MULTISPECIES: DUF58 domain-containing protein [unclassified Microbacterium]|uniref:DUF58 domain-containing protein n=1 Tax=unclassified Microbacterium TaxID=2609290 RepID=UPI0038690BEB